MIFILDKQEKVINMLKNSGSNSDANPFYDDVLTEDLATGAETFSFSTIAQGDLSKDLVVGNYVAFKKDRKYKLFQIMQVVATHQEEMEISVYAECAGLSLINQVYRARKIPSATFRKFLESVVEETDWNAGAIDIGISNSVDLDLPDSSAYATLQNNIGKYNAEIEFRVELNNGRISKKFIDAYVQRGKVTGKRFVFGKDIEGITKTIDSTNLYTALVGRGKNGTNFKNVTVEGINKPLGQDFVADQQSYELYNKNGYHLIGIFEFDTESPEELLRETYKQLQKVKEPKATYDIPVALLGHLLDRDWDQVRIGDHIGIFDSAFNPPLRLMARVSKLETSFTNPQGDKCTLSNFVEVNSNISDEMRKIASELEGYVEDKFNNKFPIGGEDIQKDAIKGEHIYENSITTDHLEADSITADKIDANQIYAEHIVAGEIKSEHIDADAIKAYHIEAGSITAESGIIGDLAVGTAQIADAAITVAKIENAFVDKIVAKEGKFESAHIGVLTADNISADTILAEHIKASVIEAINLNVEGKISADRIDVNSIVVDNIDAGKITTGDLDAERITAAVISAINLSTENATINSAKIGDLDAGKITSGEISTDILKSNIITAINASIGKINAEHIDVDSIKVGNIDAGQITTGDLDAERITASVISAINAYAGTMKIKQGQIETLKVGNANIVDLDASKIKSGKIEAERIDVEKLTVKSANIIGEINASKISGGVLDAGKMTVKNLRADSITAGSITIEGENLQKNSAFENEKNYWLFTSTQSVVDDTVKFEGVNTAHHLVSAAGSYTSESVTYVYSGNDKIVAFEGESFVASANLMVKSLTNTNSFIRLGLWFYRPDGSFINSVAVDPQLTTLNSFKYVTCSGKAPAGTGYVAFVLQTKGFADVWMGKPMLSRGTITSIWKRHNDELISDGAINNDKLGDGSVDSSKLNVQELFVGDNAFIKNLKAIEIDAAQITTGKIQGERIDLKGLISFEALDPDLQPIFDVTGDKTYINGGMIAANTIKANSIDLLSGLTVQGPDNTTTFAIKSDGNVEINGLLRSGNFDEEKKTGYQISPDGKAILNQATVRGNVILPNAGITNDYDMSQTKGRNLLQKTNQGVSGWGWSMQTGGRTFTEIIEDGIRCCKIVRDDVAQSGWSYINYGNWDPKAIEPSTKYTLSFEVKASVATTFTFRICRGDGKEILTNFSNVSATTVKDKWTKIEMTTTSLDDLSTVVQTGQIMYIVGMNSGVGVSYIFRNLKLEEGETSNDWMPAPEDSLNPVRIWAGSSYELKDSAPFRVMQNGDVYAYNANLTGILYGEVDSGFVNILKDEISLVDDTTAPEKVYFKLNPQQALFDVDIVLNNSKGNVMEFVNEDKRLIMSGVEINASGAMTDLKYDSANGAFGGLNLISQVSDGHHVLRHSSSANRNGTMIFDSEGTQGDIGDFSFIRKNGGEDVKVDIDGSLVVKTNISSGEQNIQFRSIKNEGWGFYAS